MWSEAEAIELKMVVSEMGEQWSPKTEPARTELMTPTRMVSTRVGVQSRARAQDVGERNDERHHDRHRGPARTGREGHRRGDDEREHRKPGRVDRALENLNEVIRRVELRGRGTDRPGEDEDDDRHHHRLEPCTQASKACPTSRLGGRQRARSRRRSRRARPTAAQRRSPSRSRSRRGSPLGRASASRPCR